jgi:hypothetical protein
MDRTSRWYAMNLGIVALALVLLAPHVAVEAQSAAKVSRIGFLRFGPPPATWNDAFRNGRQGPRAHDATVVVAAS